MNGLWSTLAFASIALCANLTYAQSGNYASVSHWPSLLSSSAAPTYCPPLIQNQWSSACANHGDASSLPFACQGCYPSPQPVASYQFGPVAGATAPVSNYAMGGTSYLQNPGICMPSTAIANQSNACPRTSKPCFGESATGFFGGFEFLWVRPSFDQNVALIVDPAVGNTLVPFEYDYQLSPRAWLGWQSPCGAGFRTTYFHFDEIAGTESVTAVAGATPVYLFVYGASGNLSRNANANVGQTLVSNHQLQLRALDLEATQVFRSQRFRTIFGAGVRVADMQQALRGNVFNPGGILEEAVANDLQFTGAGPTLSAQLSREIATGRFGYYAAGRGSLLVGESEQRIYEMKGAFTTELEDIAIQRKVMGNVDLGIGLQYWQPIGSNTVLFLRGGYEAQLWLDAGGPVDSQSTIGLDGITFSLGAIL